MKTALTCALLVLLCIACGPSAGPGPEGSYRVARDPTWFPLVLLGKELEVTAFSDALVQEIAMEEDFLVSIYSTAHGTLQYLLRTGQVEGILSPLPPLPSYRQAFDFSNVYLPVGPVLLVPIDTRANSIEDMKGKMVGVRTGSSAMLVVAQIPDVDIRDYMSLSDALGALLKGEVDGVVIPALPAYSYVANLYTDQLRVATPPLTDDGLRLLVAKGKNEDLLEGFNDGLKELKKKSRYTKLADKWGVEAPHHSKVKGSKAG